MNSLFFRIARIYRKNLFFMGISLAVGAMTLVVILGITESVRTYLREQSAALVGGDLSIETQSGRPLPTLPPLDRLRERGAIFSTRTDTLAMVTSHRPKERWGKLENLLCTIKVIDSSYPLYGTFAFTHGGSTQLNDDEAAVHPDMLERMGLVIGDAISIGSQRFVIKDTIANEPDRIGGTFRLGPLVVLSKDGWEKTGIDGAQTRASDTLLVRYPTSLSLVERTAIYQELRILLKGTGARIEASDDGPSTLLRVLDTASRFFFTIITLAIFLAMVNVRINLSFVLKRFERTIALFFMLGMSRLRITLLFVLMLIVTAFLGTIFGGVAGNILTAVILPYVGTLINVTLATPSLYSNLAPAFWFIIFLTSISSIGFLFQLNSIEPRSLIVGYARKETRSRRILIEVLAIILSFIGLATGIYFMTKNITLAMVASLSLTGIFAVLFIVTQLLLVLLYRVRDRFPFTIKSIIALLRHQGYTGVVAIASLSVAIGSVACVMLLESTIIKNLEREVSDTAPNIYAIDIQVDQRDSVRNIFGSTWNDFPVLRGRFMERNNDKIQERLNEEDPELRREFNLTYRDQLIAGEKVIRGTWHGETVKQAISVEEKFAERAKLTLGDQVMFLVQGMEVRGTITSIRTVESTNGLPFFFLVMSPDLLERFPQTYFGYAYVDDSAVIAAQNELSARFPNITIIPTRDILKTIREVIKTLTLGVSATSLPALILGVLLIVNMLILTLNERANDMLVMSALGIKRLQLFSFFTIEAAGEVLLGSAIGTIFASLIVVTLNVFLFEFPKLYFNSMVFILQLAILLVAVTASAWITLHLMRRSPSELLRKQ